MSKKAMRGEVSRRIEAHRDDLVRITQELVQIPSVNLPGDYEEMSRKMLALYRAEGLEPLVATATDEEIRALNLTCPRPNIIAMSKGTGGGPVFCLDAHMDVVAIGDESSWTYPPFGGEIHDGRIYGRGAEDTKGHLAIELIVFRALKEAGVELKGDLILTATVDDEIGQWPGMGYLIEKGFPAARVPQVGLSHCWGAYRPGDSGLSGQGAPLV